MATSSSALSGTSPAPAISTRFLIISDTHNYEFDQAAAHSGEFILPIPQADVLLHCGDLAEVGGVSAFKTCLEMLSTIPAELKLVIAGNHDLLLDRRYISRRDGDGYSSQEYEKPMEVMTGPLAKDAGVTYLDERIHTLP
jgi:predicted phosphodiesterase